MNTVAAERFWSKVDMLGDCWLWTRGKDRAGYGRFKLDDRTREAHVVGYELVVGRIPDGLELDHTCNVRACVHPTHLEPVTRAENNRRKGERRVACIHGHDYEPDNYWLVSNGKGRAKRCKTCSRLRRKAAA